MVPTGEPGEGTGAEWNEIDAFVADAEKAAKRLAPDYRETLLPDGMPVLVHFERAENLPHLRRWIAHFVIAKVPDMGDFAGLPIICAWNAPKPGKRVSPSHNLYRDYKAVTGLRGLVVPGNHGPSAVLGSFLSGVLVEAVTRVVSRRIDRRTGKWTETENDEHYSVVDHIVCRNAGTPRVILQRTARESPSNRKRNS